MDKQVFSKFRKLKRRSRYSLTARITSCSQHRQESLRSWIDFLPDSFFAEMKCSCLIQNTLLKKSIVRWIFQLSQAKKYNLPKGFPLLWNLFRTRKNIITEKGRFRQLPKIDTVKTLFSQNNFAIADASLLNLISTQEVSLRHTCVIMNFSIHCSHQSNCYLSKG